MHPRQVLPEDPSANSWTPEKIAMIEARKGNPGTALPVDEIAQEHVQEHQKPIDPKASPSTLATCSGSSTEKPVIMLIA